MAAVSARLIEGDGTDEEAWARAEWLAAAPCAGLDELLPPGSRLVVVSPHPDDEVLGCGGLIADALAAGRRLLVVTLTEGERAYPQDRHWRPRRLARARRRELRRALAALGAPCRALRQLALGDGRLAARQGRIVEALRGLCMPGDTVLATWVQDGHPDHEATARATRQVADELALRRFEYPVWGWHWARPQAGPFGQGLLRYRPSAEGLARKNAALDCFATQTGRIEPAPARPILPPAVLARFRRGWEAFLPA